MSKQYNKALKRQRRKKYLKRKRIAAKGRKPAKVVAAATAAQIVSVESSNSPGQAAVAAASPA